MPRLSRMRVRVLDELSHQLRFAPPDAARKHLRRAEDLAVEVLGDLAAGRAHAYPARWVLFRLTGLTEVALPSAADLDDESIVAEALLADLSALVERLCITARLTALDAHTPPDAAKTFSVDDLCQRWNVTRKTIERRRRHGLIARRILVGKGRAALVFPESSIAAFEHAEQHRQLSPPAKPPRSSHRHDASREAVARLAAGERPTDVAHDTARSRSNVQRLALCARADALAAFLPALTLPIDDDHAASLLRRQDVLLRPPPVRTSLGAPGPDSLPALLDVAASQGVAIAAVERAHADAYTLLKYRARAALLALPRDRPHVQDRLVGGILRLGLDRIETDLRWAARLKAELLRHQLPLILRTVDNVLADADASTRTRLADLPPIAATRLLETALTHAIDAVEHFDPAKGGRLAAPIGLTVTRVVTAWRRDQSALLTRAPATTTAQPRAVAVPRLTEQPDAPRAPRADHASHSLDFVARACPWQPAIEPSRRAWDALIRTDQASRMSVSIDARRVIPLRMGWPATVLDAGPEPGSAGEGPGHVNPHTGGPPLTLDETAAALHLSRTKIVRLEKSAHDALRAHTRRAPADLS